eukprot:g79730.t1
MAEQVEEEYSDDCRSPKKQRVDDDANEWDEENQQSLEHLSQEVERMTKTIEAVNGKLDDHTLPWVQSAMERHLPNILQKAVEQMNQKSVQELLETVKQSVEKSIENALAKTVNEAVEEALKRYNDTEMEAKKESLIAEAVIKKMEEKVTCTA